MIGHEKILNFFDKVIEQGNLSHAYLFVGQNHVGKGAVAEILSRRLLQIPEEKKCAHPDLLTIRRLSDEKTGKTKKDISIEQLRQARSFLNDYAFLGGHKVVVVESAEKMSSAAANALLKSLEEPKSKTILILLTVDYDRLPQTIRSRCQSIYFAPVEAGAIIKGLKKKGIEDSLATELAKDCNGLPGLAVQWSEDGEAHKSYLNEVDRFSSLGGKALHERLAAVEELFGDKKDHIAAREKLGRALDIWQANIIGQPWDPKTSVSLYDIIIETKKRLSQNIHPRLLVENIILAIP